MKPIALITISLLFLFCRRSTNSDTPQTYLPSEKVKQIESFIKETMQKTGIVPGLGVAIVKDDQVIYTNGFGYRDIENKLPATAQTSFYIASTTKSLTAMAAACLEEKGEIDLNASLASFYPGWQLPAPLDANKISLINLMSHNHRIDNGGLQFRLAFVDQISPAEHTRLLFDFSNPGDPGFDYSNTSYNVLAQILEKTTGKGWKEIVRDEVLLPIGMKHTTAYTSEAEKDEVAYPYFWKKDSHQRLPLKSDGQMQSAGGHMSTPADMANWLLVNMNEGQLNGKQVIPASVLKRIHQSYVYLDRIFLDYHRYAYELGWYRSDYEGDTLVHHFGSYNGYMAHTSFMPDHKYGVVVFGNELAHGGRLPHLVANYIYDVLLDKEDLDSKYDEAIDAIQKRANEKAVLAKQKLIQRKEMLEKAATNPEAWLYNKKQFVGSFYNYRLGHFEVKENSDGDLWATYGTSSGQLLPNKTNHFLVDWPLGNYIYPPRNLFVGYKESGEVASLSWDFREFRLLSKGTSPEDLIAVHSQIRNGLAEAIRKEEKEKSDFVYQLLTRAYPIGAITESYLNRIGYRYLRKRELAIAMAIFEFAVAKYPKSANAYDSLGEVQLANGDKEAAKENYQKSLHLDPKNENAEKVLKELME